MSEWIKISERLPEMYEDVLFYQPDTPNCNYLVGMLMQSKDEVMLIQSSNFGSCHQLCYYTHWTPLPKPPKGE